MEARKTTGSISMPQGCRVAAPALRRGWSGRVLALVVVLALAGCVSSSAGSRGGVNAPPSPGTSGTPADSVAPDAGTTDLPPGLAGRDWAAQDSRGRWVAGRVGTGDRIDLPDGETPLAETDERLATVQWEADRSSTIRIRDIATGSIVAELHRSEQLLPGAVVGDSFVPSAANPVDPSSDPGLIAISFADGSVSQVLPAVPAPSGSSDELTRTAVASPSGKTVVSGLCGAGHCAIDVVHLADGTVRRIVDNAQDVYPGPSSDDVVIAGAGDSSSLTAYDESTGEQLWTRSNGEFQYGYMTLDGHFVTSYVDHGGAFEYRVSLIDPRTGIEQVLLRQDPSNDLTLWPELSTDQFAAIGKGGHFAEATSQSPVTLVRFLDLTTGEFGHRTFVFRIDQ